MQSENLFVELNGIFPYEPSGNSTSVLLFLVKSISSMGWKNLMSAVSDASPIVGVSSQLTVALSLTCILNLASLVIMAQS